MNTCIFAGRLGKDPDFKYLPNGTTAIVKVSLAISEYKGKDENGKATYETLWIDATAFGQLAENINKVLSKGDAVVIECQYQKRPYTTQDGDTRTAHNFKIESFTKLTSSVSSRQEPEPGFEEFSGNVPF